MIWLQDEGTWPGGTTIVTAGNDQHVPCGETKYYSFQNKNEEDRYKNTITQNTKSDQHVGCGKGEEERVKLLKKRIISSYLKFSFLFGLSKQTSSGAHKQLLTPTHTLTLTGAQKDMFVRYLSYCLLIGC